MTVIEKPIKKTDKPLKVKKKSKAPIRIGKAPQGAYYQSYGVIEGALLQDGDKWMLLSDGKLLNIRQPHKRIMRWLAKQQFPVVARWSVYARSKKIGLVLQPMGIAKPEEELNEFKINGQIHSWNTDQGVIRLALKCNKVAKGVNYPFVVQVNGFLPNLKRGQFWNLTCTYEDGRLEILDGQMIAEARKDKEKNGSANLA